jgi:hypothetical protein
MVDVSDFAGAAVRVRSADELPEPVVGVVAYQQDGLVMLEDFDGLDASGAQKPVPHPPRASIPLHDAVCDPPHERQILVGASLVRGQVWAALWDLLEPLVGERERMAVLVLEDDSVERAAALIADTYPNRQPGDMGLRPRGPAERIRGKLAPRADEFAECPAVHARDLGSRHLDERTLQHLDIHVANLAETQAGQPTRQDFERVLGPGQTCGAPSGTRVRYWTSTRRPSRHKKVSTSGATSIQPEIEGAVVRVDRVDPAAIHLHPLRRQELRPRSIVVEDLTVHRRQPVRSHPSALLQHLKQRRRHG